MPRKPRQQGPRDDGRVDSKPNLAATVQAAASAPQINTSAFAPHEGKSLIAYLQAGTFTPEQVRVLRGGMAAQYSAGVTAYKALPNHDPAKLAEAEAVLAAIQGATAGLPQPQNPFGN